MRQCGVGLIQNVVIILVATILIDNGGYGTKANGGTEGRLQVLLLGVEVMLSTNVRGFMSLPKVFLLITSRHRSVFPRLNHLPNN